MEILISGNGPTAIENWRRGRAGAHRALYPRPARKPWIANSPRRINRLAEGLGATRYLEIGVERGYTVDSINVRERVGVDPYPKFDMAKLPGGLTFFEVTSDAYFDSLAPEVTFDLAFLDGLHTFEQTRDDLFNALRHVPNGVILIDDTVPSDEVASLPDLDESNKLRLEAEGRTGNWMGDVWKLVVYVENYLPELDFRTIVGRGYGQTLVWRRQFGQEIAEPAGDERNAVVAGLRYADMFKDGIPVQFRPCDESAAIQLCLAAVAPSVA
jgi:hypothetical protein